MPLLAATTKTMANKHVRLAGWTPVFEQQPRKPGEHVAAMAAGVRGATGAVRHVISRDLEYPGRSAELHLAA